MKIYFLTRSFYPYQQTGGAQIRTSQVETLRALGYEVVVVMPAYKKETYQEKEGMILIPFNGNQKVAMALQMAGVYEDYLDKWVKRAYRYLNQKVTSHDLLFATSGGELGMIKLAVKLKQKMGCRVIVNFHDPLIYSKVHGEVFKKYFHVSREKTEKKYLQQVDCVITSSQSYQHSLEQKYSFLKGRIATLYFGYTHHVDGSERLFLPQRKMLHIAYVGEFSSVQKPERMLDLLTFSDKVKLYFIGNRKGYKPLQGITDERVVLMDYMPHDAFLSFMRKEIDIGFVSLHEKYFGACVPSKIYEYINLGLPIIGLLPPGDAQELINDRGYGVAVDFNDSQAYRRAFERISERDYWMQCKRALLKERSQWHIRKRFEKVDTYLQRVIEGRTPCVEVKIGTKKEEGTMA